MRALKGIMLTLGFVSNQGFAIVVVLRFDACKK